MKCFEIDLSRLLRVTLLDRQDFVPPHKHCTRTTEEYILYVVESGRLLMHSGGEDLELSEGDVYLFDKGEKQYPISSAECTFYYLHFDSDVVLTREISGEEYCDAVRRRKMQFVGSDIYGASSYESIRALILRYVKITDKSTLGSLIGMLKSNSITYGYNTPEWRLNVSFNAARILMFLENICYEKTDGGYTGKNGRVHVTVAKLLDYVEEHYRESFKSSDIERDLFINFDYANRIFKRNTGYSIMKYRNRLRINTAKAQIADKSIADIAQALGFGSVYYFSRCFKNFEGISPDEYRESIKRGTKIER